MPPPVLPAVAVKVAVAPAHIGLVPVVCAMLTVGVRFAFTVMVIVLDDAVLVVKQVPPVTVMSQVTA